jgi:CMP-N-acetylneuraminic acid synthetase
MENCYFVIPARRNSKGVPFKNRTLLNYTFNIIPPEYYKKVIVSTDDEIIIQESRKRGFNVHIRPVALATDGASMKDTIANLVHFYKLQNRDIVTLYLTYPERTWDDVEKSIKFYRRHNGRSLLCRKNVNVTPYLMMFDNGLKGTQIINHDLTRRQDYKKVFELSHFIAISNGSEILRLKQNMYNDNTIFYPIGDVIDVDTESDITKFKNTNDNFSFESISTSVPAKDLSNDKIVVYTCITNAYDTLKEVKNPSSDIDYICYTDNLGLKSKTWQIRNIPKEVKDKRLCTTKTARYIKINPHLFFPEYTMSLWIDGSMGIIGDIKTFIANNYDSFLLMKHPVRNCIYDECGVVIKSKKEIPTIAQSQINEYKKQRMPSNNGLVQTGLILRRHNDDINKKIAGEWWAEIEKHSKRDQLSFNYVVWKNNFEYRTIDSSILNSEYIMHDPIHARA